MIPKLEDYKRIVGKKAIKKIRKNAENLKGKHIVHINSTSQGGGVAEILNSLVFLMNDLGIDAGWRLMHGSHSLFKITKGLHNGLQGKKWKMSKYRKSIYEEYCTRNAVINHINDHDIVVIHDPQPLGMVQHYEKKTWWLWRCHIDLSNPNPEVMNYLFPFMNKYDGIIISSQKFRIRNLKQVLILYLLRTRINHIRNVKVSYGNMELTVINQLFPRFQDLIPGKIHLV